MTPTASRRKQNVTQDLANRTGQELALLSRFLTAQNQAERLSSDAPEQRLQRLDYHGITLLAEARDNLDAALLTQLGQRKPMMVANEMLKQQALVSLVAAFRGAGLQRDLLFKGSALAWSIYPHPWLRPRSDSDMLIDENDLDAYREVFRQQGYEELFAMQGRWVSYQSTFSKTLSGQQATIYIDLHWKINNRQLLSNTLSHAELIRRAQSLDELDERIRIPQAIDSLLLAGLHRAGHHRHEERLIWLYDIHLLTLALSENQWQQLIDRATDRKIAALVIDALATCRRLLNTPIPTVAQQWMESKLSWQEQSAVFLRNDLPEWRLFFHDLRALDGLAAKLGWLRETLCPPAEYMRQQMGTRSLLIAHLRRLTRGLRRIFRRPRLR